MLSITLSGLNVSQKSLNVTSNNLANAGTTGFKRSEASFVDVFANDPTTGSKVAVGSGAAVGAVERSTSQGQLMTTDTVTDLAIAGRGYFTMLAKDPTTGLTDTYFTRSGNFSVNANGEMCDSQNNILQCFAVDEQGNITKDLISAKILAEKPEGSVAVKLGASAVKGTPVTLYLYGEPLMTQAVTDQDLQTGFITFASPDLNSGIAGHVSADYAETKVAVTLPSGPADFDPPTTLSDVDAKAGFGDTVELWQASTAPGGSKLLERHILSLKEVTSTSRSIMFDQPFDSTGPFILKFVKNNTTSVINPDNVNVTLFPTDPTDPNYEEMLADTKVPAASEFRGIFVQNISISSKGIIQENYSDGSKRIVGAIALATFSNEAGLKPIGNTDFVACEASGSPSLKQAGAPYAGDIFSGTLEQSNVDITAELMGMLKAQQIYNGNARMLQTEVEIASRITDKL
jgi:flagellar hook protein FlgE